MFAPEPEILLLRRILNRVFDRLEGKLDSLAARQDSLEEKLDFLTIKQDSQEMVIGHLSQRVDHLDLERKAQQDRDNEIEHLVNFYSLDGDPICNYHSNYLHDDEG